MLENIQNVFIAGAGVMGSSMAQLFAKCGYQVTLYDVSEQALVKSRELMEVNLGAAVETGRMSPETAQKIRAGIGYTQDPQDFARADYVVEAIIENMEIKKKFWSQISAIVKETAILTSNTSGLSLTEMAEAVRLPGRFCGMHWLNPPHICPLIEVIRAKETDEETMETVRAMALDIRHFPVTLNREVPGFLVNRFQFAILREAMSLVEAGVASMEDIDNLLSQRPYGFIHNDISAYYLAFILTEYASSEYSIHNGGAAISDPKEALAEAIKSTYSLKDGRYSEWFISPISATIANFYEVASRVFAFNKVTNIDSCVDYIRASVRNLEFPLWTLQYAFQLEEPVQQFIDLSVQLVGSKNASKNSTLAEKIGKLPLSEDQIDDLKRTLTKEKCWEGMRAYLNKYRDGEFWTQSSKFRCPNALQFLADKQTKDSAWLWDEETTHKCIDECIDEFRIIAKVNLAYNTSTTVDTCRDALRKWFSSLILPVDMVVKKYPQHSDLLTSLYRFSKNGSDSHLISEIVNKLDDFDEVFRISTDSTTNFRGAFDEYLTDFDDEQLLKVIEKVNKTDPNSISLDQFNRMVTNAISETSKGMKKQELISLWKKETGTDSPKDWSTKHLTPIKALFEAKESESVELVINVLSGIATDKQYIEKALKYLKNSDMLSLLNDQEHIDKSFREKVLRQYSSIFQDLEKVRAELYKKQKNVDSWLHNTSLIEELAKKEYDSNAKARALDVINSIPLEQLQKYLRTQVETNMALGIEILRQYK